MILFINACVRENSRTKRLADYLLAKCGQPVTELRLWEADLPRVNGEFLRRREELIGRGELDDPSLEMARQFARADEIVIAAPFWDLSFPAVLKQYLEQINAVGVTFRYTPQGIPQGMCRARRLFYVTTAGGEYVPEEYGFGYVKALAQNFYGISDVQLIKAAGLDIEGADEEGILQNAVRQIDKLT